MSHRFKTKKLTSALAFCGIALFSIHANAAYVFRVAVPGLKAQTGISVSPANFNFGNVYAGQTTSSNFVVTNVGGLAVGGLQYQVSGPFTLSGNCGTSLAAGAQCTESITFAPTAGQAYSGTFTATNGSVAASASLQGTGQQVILGVSPASLSFGSVLVGSSSAPQSFTLTNTGNVAATGLTLTAPSGYSESTTCGSTLAAGGTCTGTVTFSPTTAGAANSQVSITSSNATGSNVAVTGTGTTAILSASALSFGTVNDYTTTTQSLTVNNTGTGHIEATGGDTAVGVLTYSYAGDVVVNNAGSIHASGANFNAGVVFESGYGSNTLNNLTGGVVSADGDDGYAYAVLGSYGVETLNNSGRILGAINLYDGDDVFNNKSGGVWDVGSTTYSDFGSGSDTVGDTAGLFKRLVARVHGTSN